MRESRQETMLMAAPWSSSPVAQWEVARYPFCSRFHVSIIGKLKSTVEKLERGVKTS